MTGGEDGMVIWWNFSVESCQEPVPSTGKLIVESSVELPVLKPVHLIQLSVNAQIYGVILGPSVCCIAQNDFILTFYHVSYEWPKQTDVSKGSRQPKAVQPTTKAADDAGVDEVEIEDPQPNVAPQMSSPVKT